MREVKQAREDFIAEYGFCWVCGTASNLCVHEMAKGHANREAALSRRYTWFCACYGCNGDELEDYSKWPLVRQLAAKWRHDWKHFWLVAFNILRGRGGMAIEFREIIPWILRDGDGWQ